MTSDSADRPDPADSADPADPADPADSPDRADPTDSGLPTAVRRAALLAGPAGVVVAFGSILGAAALTPGFSWTGDALSDLGRAGMPYRALFNRGLAVAGLLGTAFVGRVATAPPRRSERLATASLGGATLSLTAIGLVPAGHPSGLHLPASVAFFVFVTVGLAAFGVADRQGARTDDRRSATTGLVAVGLGATNLAAWLVYALVARAVAGRPGVALPELVGAVALAAWVVAVAVRTRSDHRVR